MTIAELEQITIEARRAYKIAERKDQFSKAAELRVKFRALLRELYAARGVQYPFND